MKQKVEVSADEISHIVRNHLVEQGALPKDRDVKVYVLPKKTENDAGAVFANMFGGGTGFGGLEFEILPPEDGEKDENRDQTDA